MSLKYKREWTEDGKMWTQRASSTPATRLDVITLQVLSLFSAVTRNTNRNIWKKDSRKEKPERLVCVQYDRNCTVNALVSRVAL
jgi:hypothetical protein